MLSKELEILKQIEELYSGDISEEEFMQECIGKETKITAWREAFAEYPLYEVQKAINHYYVKKSSKTRPNIAQITAILDESGVVREIKVDGNVEPCLAIKYQQQDKEDGNMHWFVPDYIAVERLIRADKWGFVQNIYKPTLDEFHRCLEYYCEGLTGKKHRFYSDNDIATMSYQEKQDLYAKCSAVNLNFFKKLN